MWVFKLDKFGSSGLGLTSFEGAREGRVWVEEVLAFRK